jgi:hypothetical protein
MQQAVSTPEHRVLRVGSSPDARVKHRLQENTHISSIDFVSRYHHQIYSSTRSMTATAENSGILSGDEFRPCMNAVGGTAAD